jgi:5-carboxymethyl-2-hydroxymuconate isomerase
MKQTAVEWLMEIDKSRAITIEEWQQAKEMEKEQMIDFAFKYGDLTTRQIADAFDNEYKTNEK